MTTVSSTGGSVLLDEEGDALPALTRMTSSVATSSVLAQRLAPPEAPAPRDTAWSKVHSHGTLGGLLVYIPLFFAAWQGTWGGIAAWGLTLVYFGSAAGAYAPVAKIRERLRQEHEWNVKRWQRLVARWDQLRYCPSCDSVADLTAGRTASASDMSKLLRSA